MKILIRHRRTKMFCKNANAWTDKEEYARVFPNALYAFNYAAESRLADIEVVFRPISGRVPQVKQTFGAMGVSTSKYSTAAARA